MNDQLQRKLTAYVDGELSPRERAGVERLVADNPLASDLLKSLASDSARLKALPSVTAPPDLAREVLKLIEISGRKPRARHAARSPSGWWHVAAASVVFALGAGSYWLLKDLARPDLPGASGGLAAVSDEPARGSNVLPPSVALPTEANPPRARTEQEPDRPGVGGDAASQAIDKRNDVADAAKVGAGQANDIAKEATVPTFAEPDYLTSPMLGPTKKFKTMDLRLPPIVDLKTARLDELFAGLDRDNLYGLDLVCNDNAKALARFQSACQTAGIRTPLQPHLGKRIAVPCMAYLENVSAAQLAKLLTALRDQDAKAEEAQKGDGQFESLFVQTLDEAGRKGVAEALGVTPSTLNPPAASGRIDPSKPIANDTLKSLEQQSTGQGGGKPAAQPTVVVMPYVPLRNRATLSKDLKLHLEMRRGWQPDALHAFFYFRAARP
jgi:hypothetical protein